MHHNDLLSDDTTWTALSPIFNTIEIPTGDQIPLRHEISLSSKDMNALRICRVYHRWVTPEIIVLILKGGRLSLYETETTAVAFARVCAGGGETLVVGEAPVVALSQKMHGGIGYAGIGWWWVESSSLLRWMVSPEKGCGRRVGALLIETAWSNGDGLELIVVGEGEEASGRETERERERKEARASAVKNY
ncbi:hypothetical protein U1Q18_005236 [Sarracenia purpurea var. burkii]